MIYLDNSSTTRKKPLSVIITSARALKYSANPNRASHKLALRSSLKVFEVRERIKKFFNAPNNSSVVFTYNCTESLNTVIMGTAKQNGNVIVTAFEHNSTLRPLYNLQKTHNITITVISPNKDGQILEDDIIKNINSKTYLVVVNQTSNVTGSTTKLNKLGSILQEKGILLLIDAAQSAGHEKIDMTKLGANFICIAGHKGLFGPQGIGALVVNNAEVNPLKFGGSGTNSLEHTMPSYYPDRLEAGTINTPGIFALGAGIKFVENHFDKINNKVEKLSNILMEYLKTNQNIKLYSSNPHSGVISFEFKNLDSNEAANILNEKYKICVRSGLHCAPLIHTFLGTQNSGLIRVSISYFNTKTEIKKLIKALNKMTTKKD